jgi:asparagine synthetase B (glutamine-hydrolysing)
VSYARHWDYNLRPGAAGGTEADHVAHLSGLLRTAAAQRVAWDAPLLVPISGGWDSRGLLASLDEAGAREIQTVSWGVEESTPGTDAYVGRMLAERFGVRHTFLRREAGDLPDDLDRMLGRMEGLTDDAAIHHNELKLIERARDELGASVLIRGDECFGFGGPAETETEAFRRVAIHSPEDVPAVRLLLQAGVAAELIAGARAIMAQVSRECPHEDFLDRKDYFYFHQRLRHYLNRSTYYKLTVLEVQNPWLDRAILDFIGTVPRTLRIDKKLYRSTLSAMYPGLQSIAFASRHSLEDWGDVMRGSQRVRDYLADELVASRNRFHDFVDPASLDRLLRGVLEAGRGTPVSPGSAVRSLLARSPRLYRFLKRKLASRIAGADVKPTTILLRALVAKRWFDRFEQTLA